MATVNPFVGVAGGFRTNSVQFGGAFGVQAQGAFGPSFSPSQAAFFGAGAQLQGGWGSFLGQSSFSPGFVQPSPVFAQSASALNANGGFGTASAISSLFSFGGAPATAGFPPNLGQPQVALGGFAGFSPHLGQPQVALGGFAGFSPHLGQPQAALGGFAGFPPNLAQPQAALGGFAGFSPHLGQPQAALGGFAGFPPNLAQPQAAFGGFSGFPPHLAQPQAALGGFSGFPPHLGQPQAEFGLPSWAFF